MIIIWNAYVKKFTITYCFYYMRSCNGMEGEEEKKARCPFLHSFKSFFTHIATHTSGCTHTLKTTIHTNQNCHEDVKEVKWPGHVHAGCKLSSLSPSLFPHQQSHGSGGSQKYIIWQFLVVADVVGSLSFDVSHFPGGQWETEGGGMQLFFESDIGILSGRVQIHHSAHKRWQQFLNMICLFLSVHKGVSNRKTKKMNKCVSTA